MIPTQTRRLASVCVPSRKARCNADLIAAFWRRDLNQETESPSGRLPLAVALCLARWAGGCQKWVLCSLCISPRVLFWTGPQIAYIVSPPPRPAGRAPLARAAVATGDSSSESLGYGQECTVQTVRLTATLSEPCSPRCPLSKLLRVPGVDAPSESLFAKLGASAPFGIEAAPLLACTRGRVRARCPGRVPAAKLETR